MGETASNVRPAMTTTGITIKIQGGAPPTLVFNAPNHPPEAQGRNQWKVAASPHTLASTCEAPNLLEALGLRRKRFRCPPEQRILKAPPFPNTLEYVWNELPCARRDKDK